MSELPQVFLEPDDEIRGQKYICLSFLSPEKVLKDKNLYFFAKFLDFYALDYKVKATESFLMNQLRDLQNVLADIQLQIENTTGEVEGHTTELKAALKQTDGSLPDVTKTHALTTSVTKSLKELSEKVVNKRSNLSATTASAIDEHVKSNMTDFKESTIIESYESFMLVNRQKLEDEFHKENKFRTTVRGLKCRGVYSTHEQAVARAQALHKKDPHFSVYVAEVGQWLPWDPEPDEVSDQQYGNEQLNTLMKSYRENAAKRDEFFEEQKRQRVAEAAVAAKDAKKAQFGEKGKEVDATQVARDLFESVPDLALQKKMESTIHHTP
jgi:hypothetical protein